METIISLVVAADVHNAIGQNNQLLWHLPADMKFFRELTSGHPVIMGRKTFDSIGKPLKNRQNIVISRDTSLQIEGCTVVHSLEAALNEIRKAGPDEAFIIGGAEIYRQSMQLADRIYLTRVFHTFPDADTFLPKIDASEWDLATEKKHSSDDKNPYDYSFLVYNRKKS